MHEALNHAKLAMLFRKEFELCNVRKGETIVLLSDLGARRDYVAAAFAAAEDFGADAYEMCVNAMPSWTKVGVETVGRCKGTLEAIKAADMLVCLHIPLFTRWLKEAREAGTRVLMVIDGPDELETLMAPPGLKQAVICAGDRLQRAKTMRITRPGGTDLTVKLGEYPTMIQYGYAESPGRFDHWGAGHVHTFPNEGSANGTVVLAPGDIVVLPYCRYVQDEVRLDIRDGFVRNIEGGLDAKLMMTGSRATRRMRTTSTVMPSRISAGGSTRRAAGTRWRCMAPIPSVTTPAHAVSPVTFCSRPAPTRRAAASARPKDITTCRCATARSRSTTTSSSSAAS